MNISCTLSQEDSTNLIIADCLNLLKKHGFTEDEINAYVANLSNVIKMYRDSFGPDKKIQYFARKRFKKIECTLFISGEKLNPLDDEHSVSTKARVDKALSTLLVNRTDQVSYLYSARLNIVTISSPLIQAKSFLQSPMLWSTVLGIALGILCTHLPDNVNTFIIDDILEPVFKVCVGIITGIMVPVVFVSLLTSISALQSIDDLTNLGFKIINRFLITTASVMFVGIAVTLFFYHNFGVSTVDFAPKNLIELLLNIIPTDLVSPFLNGNTPQLVVLALFFGAALLMVGDKADKLKDILGQMNAWIMSAMGIAMTIVPIIPFISILSTIATGDGLVLLKGWEFIVASYVIATICGIAKLILVCTTCKVNVLVIWKKLWPMVSNAFVSSNNTTILKMEYDISRNELGITPEFSSFWIPMSQAMLNPRQTINMVIPPILILKYMGEPITTQFLIIYILLVLELSIANPGTTGCWTILFAALALPSPYVGTFMMYKLFTANFNAGYGALQVGLEQIRAASLQGEIDLDKLREKPV